MMNNNFYIFFFSILIHFTFGADDLKSDSLTEYNEVLKCLHKDDVCLIICDQLNSGVYIYNIEKPQKPIWSLVFSRTAQIKNHEKKKFKAISDAKLVFKDYIVICTSGGAIAIIEIKTKRIIKSIITGGNLHSIDLAPDGSIFAVASTENFLVAVPALINSCSNFEKPKKWNFPFGHAVTWDYKESKVWLGGNHTLESWKYNYDSVNPILVQYQKFYVEDEEVHEVVTIPETDYLWVSTLHFVCVFNYRTGNIMQMYTIFDLKSISTLLRYEPTQKHSRSITSTLNEELINYEKNIDPEYVQNIYAQGGIKKWKNGYKKESRKIKRATDKNGKKIGIGSLEKKTIFVEPSNPDKNWWNNQVFSLSKNKPILILKKDAKIYKARWLDFNSFSYELFNPKKW